jgi:hypothetical protein
MTLIAQGQSVQRISLATGIARATLRDWRDNPEKLTLASNRTCPRCSDVRTAIEPQRDYAYFLGLYLGDGCINLMKPKSKGVWMLRITCADACPA